MGSQADLDFNLKDLTRARTLTIELAEFSARAGHDLLGPLNQASALLALFVQGGLVQGRFAQDNDREADAEARTLLELLQASAARMQGVVNGVQPYLDIAATAPDFEAVDMNTALASAQLRLEKAISDSSAVIAPEFGCNCFPRILLQLFEAKTDAFFFIVEFKHFDFDFVAHIEDF